MEHRIRLEHDAKCDRCGIKLPERRCWPDGEIKENDDGHVECQRVYCTRRCRDLARLGYGG